MLQKLQQEQHKFSRSPNSYKLRPQQNWLTWWPSFSRWRRMRRRSHSLQQFQESSQIEIHVTSSCHKSWLTGGGSSDTTSPYSEKNEIRCATSSTKIRSAHRRQIYRGKPLRRMGLSSGSEQVNSDQMERFNGNNMGVRRIQGSCTAHSTSATR